jgi:cyclase
MLARRIIPCLDVAAGRVVKGVQFQGLRDAGDPVELAKRYSDEGADEIVFLDISATLEGRGALLEIVEKTAAVVRIPLTVGGGVREVADARRLLSAGADKVGVNSAAIARPELLTVLAAGFGSQAVVLAIDAYRSSDSSFRVRSRAGTSETSLDAVEWAKRGAELGAGEVLLTSIDCDGGSSGFDLELTKAVAEAVNVPVIASGGAGSVSDFVAVLTEGKADAALAASVFHYNRFSIREVKECLARAGVLVRPV